MTSGISKENPLGLLAIDHLEFCRMDFNSPIKDLFHLMGFQKIFEHPETKSELFSQGQVRFLVTGNNNPHAHSRRYFEAHKEGVSKISFVVANVEHALNEAVDRGAALVDELKVEKTDQGIFKTGSIRGFGDVINEFVERPKEHFRPGYVKVENDPFAKPLKQRLARLDHLTNNVPKGEMKKWVEFYQRIYGFEVTRYFEIKGQKTGLNSKVVQLNDGNIIIPINEPSEWESKSQIQEFLDVHKGPGVQHIALSTPDIVATVAELRERGMKFLEVPPTYYQDIPKRPFKVEEDLKVLEQNQILVDGDEKGYLLQLFSHTYIGPAFFEIIERKNHGGFGEGNFQALFDAIERDQMDRGYLK